MPSPKLSRLQSYVADDINKHGPLFVLLFLNGPVILWLLKHLPLYRLYKLLKWREGVGLLLKVTLSCVLMLLDWTRLIVIGIFLLYVMML